MTDVSCNNKPFYIIQFDGEFNGNGFTIGGIKPSLYLVGDTLTGTKCMGFFITLYGANVYDLTIAYMGATTFSESQYSFKMNIGGFVRTAYSTTITNCIVEGMNIVLVGLNNTSSSSLGKDYQISMFAGIIDNASSIASCKVYNCNITFSTYDYSQLFCGGMLASGSTTVTNCIVDNCTFNFTTINEQVGTCYIGGVVGGASTVSVDNRSNIEMIFNNLTVDDSAQIWVGGISANGKVSNSYFDGTISGQIDAVDNGTGIRIGGIVGCSASSTVENSIFAGTIDLSSGYKLTIGGICGRFYNGYAPTNCLSQGTIKVRIGIGHTAMSSVGGISGYYDVPVHINYCVGNSYIIVEPLVSSYAIRYKSSTIYSYATGKGGSYGNADRHTSTGVNYESSSSYSCLSAYESFYAYTDEEMKTQATFSALDFENVWYMSESFNNGYPYLRAFLPLAIQNGFEQSGTESDPYLIDSLQKMQGFVAMYNDNYIEEEYYWKLVDDIDISLDGGGATINWVPICYELAQTKSFNGHLDGNGKTISGLTITEQYENVGLFGRMASNATITNLNVTGTISWDQAKYVGGVVGLMEDGAILTNCSFTGTITGYLNSGNHAVVGGLSGKYSADAITGIANYDCYVYGADNYTTFNRYTSTYAVA